MKLLRNLVIMMLMALPLVAQDLSDRDGGATTETPDEKAGQVNKDTSGIRANRSFTVTGDTTGGPTYDRIFGGGTDNTCNLSVTFSGTGVGVNYAIVEFFSPTGGLWDGVEVNAGGTTIGDTTMTLYCDPFDPANADQNVVVYDDDGGSGLLSAITAADGVMLQANTSYFIVLGTFGPGDVGAYQLDFAGDVQEGPPCTINPYMGLYVDGDYVDVSLSGVCLGGVDIYNSSVGGALATGVVVDGTTIVENLPFYPDSYYYATPAGDPGNVLAQTDMTVPTLGEWGLIAFLSLLCASGIYFMRRRRIA